MFIYDNVIMEFSLLVLAAAVGSVFSTGVEGGVDNYDLNFQEWLSENKAALTEEELDPAEVYQNWLENAKFVEHHNSLGLNYKVALNAFAHMKFDTRKESLSHPLPQDQTSNTANNFRLRDIPDSIDWRKKGVILPVSNQGQVGDSWSIHIVHSVASLWAIENGQLVVASVKEYQDCCKNSSSGYECIVDIGGLALESKYPENATTCLSKEVDPAIVIKGGRTVGKGDEMALARAVASLPVVVGVDASHLSFQLYKSGVYSSLFCSKKIIDHFMLVVGYGRMNGEDYWLCQNSWGSDWGMDGYIMIKRNANNMCGIASDASYPY